MDPDPDGDGDGEGEGERDVDGDWDGDIEVLKAGDDCVFGIVGEVSGPGTSLRGN